MTVRSQEGRLGMAEGAAGSGPARTGTDSFVHLHVHSEYSMLDGAARVADLFQGCAEMGMPAIAMTDHGNLFGAYEFYKASKATGVKPIIGLEAYVTPKTHRSERKRVRWGEAADAAGDDVSGCGSPKTSSCRSSPPTTCTTHTGKTRPRTRCCSASSQARPWPTPTGSSS